MDTQVSSEVGSSQNRTPEEEEDEEESKGTSTSYYRGELQNFAKRSASSISSKARELSTFARRTSKPALTSLFRRRPTIISPKQDCRDEIFSIRSNFILLKRNSRGGLFRTGFPYALRDGFSFRRKSVHTLNSSCFNGFHLDFVNDFNDQRRPPYEEQECYVNLDGQLERKHNWAQNTKWGTKKSLQNEQEMDHPTYTNSSATASWRERLHGTRSKMRVALHNRRELPSFMYKTYSTLSQNTRRSGTLLNNNRLESDYWNELEIFKSNTDSDSDYDNFAGQRTRTASSVLSLKKRLPKAYVPFRSKKGLGEPNTDSKGQSDDISLQELTEKIKQLQNAPIPLRKKLKKMSCLRDDFKIKTGQAWKGDPSYLKRARSGLSTFGHFIDKLKIWKPLIRRVEGHFGPSGVAIFSFILDLLGLNFLLSIILLNGVVLPVIFLQEERMIDEDPEEWKAGWTSWENSTFGNDHCPHVNLSNNDSIINNCSDKYLEQVRWKNSTDDMGDHPELLIPGIITELLMGKGRLEFTPLFLGYYPPEIRFIGYPVPAVYILSTTLVFLISLAKVVFRVGQWLRYNTMAWRGQKFSETVFTGYDFSLRNSNSVAWKQRMVRNELCSALNEARFQQSKSQRTPKRMLWILFKRVIINAFIVVLVMFNFFVIMIFTAFQTNLQDWLSDQTTMDPWMVKNLSFIFKYSDTLVIGILCLFIPPLISKLGSWEEYTNRNRMLLFIIRNGLIRLFSLGVLVITHLEQAGQVKGRICDSNLLCWETLLAQELFSQLVWEFLTRMVGMLIRVIFVILATPCRCLKLSVLPEYDVPDKVIDIIFIQTIFWVSVPLSPVLPLLCYIFLIIVLWTELFSALVMSRPSERVFLTSRSSATFMVALALSWLWSAGVTVGILAFVRPSLGCGPFKGLAKAWDALTHNICIMDGSLTTFRSILFRMDDLYVTLPLGLILFVFFVYYLCILHLRSTTISHLKAKLKEVISDNAFLLDRAQRFNRN